MFFALFLCIIKSRRDMSIEKLSQAEHCNLIKLRQWLMLHVALSLSLPPTVYNNFLQQFLIPLSADA
jgi:hypothetical protein